MPRPPSTSRPAAAASGRATASSGTAHSVSAERGYLRETGNLVFHTALVGMLAHGRRRRRLRLHRPARAGRGRAVRQRARQLRLVQPRPVLRRVERSSRTGSRSTTSTSGTRRRTSPATASRTTSPRRCRRPRAATGAETTIKVNSPLHVGGTEVYLLGNGYAPVITVRDADGRGRHVAARAVPSAGRQPVQRRRRQGAGRARRAGRIPRASLPDHRPARQRRARLQPPGPARPHPHVRGLHRRPRPRRRHRGGRLHARHRIAHPDRRRTADEPTIELKPATASTCRTGSAASSSPRSRASSRSTSTTTRPRAGCSGSRSPRCSDCSRRLFIPRRRVWVKVVGDPHRVRGPRARRGPDPGCRGGRPRGEAPAGARPLDRGLG